MKIVVLANCQNVMVSTLIRKCLGEKFDVFSFSHATLLAEKSLDCTADADLIITQPLSDRFGRHSARELKDRFGARCCVVPALFFRGYFPDLCYVGPESRRVQSPLGDYHSALILAAYLSGCSVPRAADFIDSERIYHDANLLDVAVRSIQELREREALCDVEISDVIESDFRDHQLFLTTNHPTSYLFKKLVARIMDRFSIGAKGKLVALRDDVVHNDLLGLSISRISPIVARCLSLRFSQPLYIQSGSNGRALNKVEFVNRSFKLYRELEQSRLVPRIPEWEGIRRAVTSGL